MKEGGKETNLSEACHGFHAGTAGVHNDGEQQGDTNTDADAADPADAHLQGACATTTFSQAMEYDAVQISARQCSRQLKGQGRTRRNWRWCKDSKAHMLHGLQADQCLDMPRCRTSSVKFEPHHPDQLPAQMVSTECMPHVQTSS